MPQHIRPPSPVNGRPLRLPNARRLFKPDPGYTFFDIDLDRADLQVVVWESGDTELKAALRAGEDIHQLNADAIGIDRYQAKVWVHGTNYGAQPPTMARTLGIPKNVAEDYQRKWFALHPGIKDWHDRIQDQLDATATVMNRFGFKYTWFDRPQNLLPEALAWIPQSTVAIVINKIWMNIWSALPEVQVLLQVHDSIAGQYPTHLDKELRPKIHEQCQITVPYDDPLVIPVGIKTSDESWGACKEVSWDG